jgi:hypothetical protein
MGLRRHKQLCATTSLVPIGGVERLQDLAGDLAREGQGAPRSIKKTSMETGRNFEIEGIIRLIHRCNRAAVKHSVLASLAVGRFWRPR